MKTIRVLGEIKKSWLDGNLYPVRQMGSFEEYRDSLPPDGTPIQIEISPADAPTREELVEALRGFADWVNSPTKKHPADTMGRVESLLSRCKEADNAD